MVAPSVGWILTQLLSVRLNLVFVCVFVCVWVCARQQSCPLRLCFKHPLVWSVSTSSCSCSSVDSWNSLRKNSTKYLPPLPHPRNVSSTLTCVTRSLSEVTASVWTYTHMIEIIWRLLSGCNRWLKWYGEKRPIGEVLIPGFPPHTHHPTCTLFLRLQPTVAWTSGTFPFLFLGNKNSVTVLLKTRQTSRFSHVLIQDVVPFLDSGLFCTRCVESLHTPYVLCFSSDG